MAGYTKLFSSIITSTIWQEDAETKVIWITLLALKEKDGISRTSIPGLAYQSHVSIEKCESVIKKFQEPDPYSRSKEFDGRRIQEVDGGFLILNHEKYRKMMSKEERREYVKEKVRKYREKKQKNADF